MQELGDLLRTSSLIAFFVILAYVLRKGLPSWVAAWKEVRLAEVARDTKGLAVRELEAQAVSALAASTSQLTGIFTKVEETTSEMKLFLRAAMRRYEAVEDRFAAMESRLEVIEQNRSKH